MNSTSWKFSLNVVIFNKKKQSLEFLTKFLYSNQMFSRNIFTTLCLKSERSAHAQLANTLLYILFKKILTRCHWGYLLKNGVTRRHHECGHATFPGTSYDMCNFLVELSTFRQAMKMTFGCNKFCKKTVQNLQTRTHF